MQIDIDAARAIIENAMPHVRELGVALVDIEETGMVLKLDYQDRLVGDPGSGVLHGGVLTVLLDTACGLSTYTRLQSAAPLATLDLRIDYLRPARAGEAVHAAAECYRVTRHVAFCRGVAYHEDRNEPIAHCAGTFMLGTRGAAPVKGIDR